MRRIKLHLRTVTLQKWFPPHDTLAAVMARLCVLREDFMLELRGLQPDVIEEIDQHSDKWRRMYFLRNSVRTLAELRSAIETLQTEPEFKHILKMRPKTDRQNFKVLVGKLNQAHQLVKNIRNWVGGHVLQERVQRCLDNMTPDQWGFFEVGPKLKDTHYKFAGEIAATMFVADTDPKQRSGQLENDFEILAGLIGIVAIVDDIFLWYLEARHLI